MPDIRVNGEHVAGSERVLTQSALEFLARLANEFEPRRQEILAARRERAARQAAGERLDFLPATAHVRDSDWQVAPAPADLNDRRVEITGPAERQDDDQRAQLGRQGLHGRLRGLPFADVGQRGRRPGSAPGRGPPRADVRSPEGKEYRLERRPRDARRPAARLAPGRAPRRGRRAPISGCLFDFGLYFFHNGGELLARGTGPYFYLPKLEGHLEARLWNDVFVWAQDALGVPHGTIRATVLIETIWAAFEMDEILYELREHAAGLNAGRWDYIFCVIKTFRHAARRRCCPIGHR